MYLQPALDQLDQCTINGLFDWICGRENFGRAAALVAIATTLLGTDEAVAERLHLTRGAVNKWRNGHRLPDDENGNRRALSELVFFEVRRLETTAMTPEYPTDYNIRHSFQVGQWIRHSFGLGRVVRHAGKKKIEVLFQEHKGIVTLAHEM